MTLEVQDSLSVGAKEAVAGCRVVAGAYSTLMLEAWLGGCKLVYLDINAWPPTVLARHHGSPNVLHMGTAKGLAEIKGFLGDAAILDAEERSRLAGVSAGCGS